jgi:hypothetical protein
MSLVGVPKQPFVFGKGAALVPDTAWRCPDSMPDDRRRASPHIRNGRFYCASAATCPSVQAFGNNKDTGQVEARCMLPPGSSAAVSSRPDPPKPLPTSPSEAHSHRARSSRAIQCGGWELKTAFTLIGALVWPAHAVHAQQQSPVVPIPPTNGTAMAVAPSQNGESAVWITSGGFVFYCVHRPAPDPDKAPAGGIACSGGHMPVPPQR